MDNLTVGTDATEINITTGSADPVFVEVGSVATGTVGGSASWGGISGTLSNQTDLQNALNAKQNTNYSQTAIRSVSANTTMTATDGTIEVDTTSGAITVTLLAASAWLGRILNVPIIKGNNYVTIQPNGTDTVGGLSTVSFNTPSGAVGNSSLSLESDGVSNWIIT